MNNKKKYFTLLVKDSGSVLELSLYKAKYKLDRVKNQGVICTLHVQYSSSDTGK